MKEDNGPLIALVLFIILSLVFGLFAYQSHSALIGNETTPALASEIKRKQGEIDDLHLQIKAKRVEVAQLASAIRQQEEIYDYYADLYDDYTSEYNRRLKLLDVATKYDQQAVELSGSINKLKQDTLGRVSSETTAVRESMETEVQAKNTERDAAISNKNKVKEEFEGDRKKFQLNKNYTQTELDNSKSILTDLTQRDIERANIFNEPDGHIVLADPVNNTVVIDIGTAGGVKNGFRFEVFAMRPGMKHVRKAFIEVRKADVSKSECYVIQRPVALPRDPLSPYVAGDPEEMYSPYQESGRKDATAQPLSGRPKVVLSGAALTDPIVEGDLIMNPFFSPGKTYTFYLAGAKKVENDRQKSAIRYRWTEIKNVIESYGAKVSPVADTNVNFVIAQKNPETDGEDAERAEFKKAKDLGLPVIYEWELFRFLDTK